MSGACDEGACLYEPRDAVCADGERCEVVIGCTTGCPSSCDDGDPCTEDACDGARCQHAPNTAVCDDGTFCNGADACAAGACTEHSGDPCGGSTVCDEAAGTCVGCATDADCPDPSPGPWSSCAGFDDTCDETGIRARTVTSYACADGVCSPAEAMEDEACSRSREGIACGPGGATCAGGACSCPGGRVEETCSDGVDDDCDGDVDCADADCDGVTCGAGGRVCAAGACECSVTPPTLIGSLAPAAPRIEWDGAAFGVLYSTSDYYFARISETGSELASDVAVTTAGSVAHPAHFAFNGTTEYGIAWSDTRAGSNDVYFRRITTAGALSGPELVVSNDSPLEAFASIGWDGIGYGVVWSEGSSSDLDLRFRRYTAAGSPATAEVMSLDTPGFLDTTEAVGIGGGQLAVGFHETSGPVLGVYIAILDSSGRDLDGSTRVDDIGGGAAIVDLAWTGSEVGIVWVDGRHGDSEIYFATANTSGVVSPNVRITNAAGVSSTPRIAWSGSELGVVWMDERSGSSQIYFRRLSSTGAPIGGEELLSCAVRAISPDVAWSGTSWGVVWSNQDGGGSRLAFRAVAP